jgi:type II secretory pathway pseudopilin PulG
MKKQSGFTLVELVVFIVILIIVTNSILLSSLTAASKLPAMHNEMLANQAAMQCMDGFVGQRRLNGYISPFTTTGAVSPLPTFCTAPAGYSIAANISAGPTINNDSTYKTLTVTVSGLSTMVYTMLIANY